MTTKNKKKIKKSGKNDDDLYCCSLCKILKKILGTKYEIVNTVDKDSIYSVEQETVKENAEYGPRLGQKYVKSDLIEQMMKEAKAI